MTISTAVRPLAGEYHPYYERYIDLVTEPDALQALEKSLEEMRALLPTLTETQGSQRYAPGKWTVRQLIGHVLDSERVFAYRALRFARGDRTALPGFDENVYAEAAGSDRLSVAKLARDLELLRGSTIALFESLDEEAWTRRGAANDVEISVRALAFVIAGHGRHHMKILRERYLSKP